MDNPFKVGDVIKDADDFNLLPIGTVLVDGQDWIHTKVRDWQQHGEHTTEYVDPDGVKGTFGACWNWGPAYLTALPDADADVTALRVEVAALRDENARLTKDITRLRALRKYVQEELLTDEQASACAGFTHGYKAGELR